MTTFSLWSNEQSPLPVGTRGLCPSVCKEHLKRSSRQVSSSGPRCPVAVLLSAQFVLWVARAAFGALLPAGPREEAALSRVTTRNVGGQASWGTEPVPQQIQDLQVSRVSRCSVHLF